MYSQELENYTFLCLLSGMTEEEMGHLHNRVD